MAAGFELGLADLTCPAGDDCGAVERGHGMNRTSTIAATAVAAVSTIAGGVTVAGTAKAAEANSLPKIQTGTGVPPYGWHRTWKVRPGYIYFGEGAGYSAPRMKASAGRTTGRAAPGPRAAGGSITAGQAAAKPDTG